MEHWKEIPGFSMYEASTRGNIRNKYTKHVLCAKINNGYRKCALMNNKKRYCCRYARMVAITWIPNPHKYTQVDHIDENKLNDSIDNLEWVTPSMNCKRRFAKNKNCTKPVALKFENDEQILYFANSREAAKHFEISSATVWGASINGKWKSYTIRRISQEEFNQNVSEQDSQESE